MHIIRHTAISQIKVIGLSGIFGCQCINLFHYRQHTYLLPISTYGKDAILHLALITDGTCHLEVGESLALGFIKQFFREFGQLYMIVSPLVQLFRGLHDILQLVEEPFVYLGQVVNLIDGITGTHSLRDDKDTFVGRLTQCLIDIGNDQFLIFHETVHALAYHAKTFLDSFFKGASDSHNLSYRLHAGT